ncbi:MAG TPA: alpha/beta hydrolase [Steroidobacteraceae bacterium]|jgi:pimeloyl-ACP methyl ester carboxylesterase|nr:alpha/beta hydrolase [Steroidobacteraceae bacterium]
MQTQRLTIGGAGIEYRFAGSDAAGRDIVMLHEGLGSTSMWRDFPERLAQATRARVLAYSRRGYGGSAALNTPRSLDYMHEEARVHLPVLLSALGIQRPILFGHSDGASIALIQAAEPGSTARAVVALAPHVKVEALTVRSIEQTRAAFESTDLRARLARHHVDVDGTFWGWNRIWLDPRFRTWNIEGLLPRIRCPVLAMQGTEDEYGTLEQIDSIERAVPGAQALPLSDSRHSPHRDQPDRVLAATRRFLDERIPA